MTDLFKQIDAILHPRSIAFVGITTSNPFHWTRTFWTATRAFGFKGPLYPVNPRGGELDGCRVYTSLDEVPGDVDFIIGTVAARTAPEIMKKCAGKGVRGIHFCTAGFAETEQEDVARLQDELTRLSRETGIRIIGPNCMGVYCPESRVSFDSDFSRESGPVGLISQSGANANHLIKAANRRGVKFSKVISYGNACDLNECDLLEYLIEDPHTQIIALYLEGVKDGRRFFNLMKKATAQKPVVLLKAGIGDAGARAAATHTASLSGSDNIWEALCRQMNIIRVVDTEELVDVLVTLCFIPDPGGRNVVLIGPGGGSSVLITDDFERHGFRLPRVPDSIVAELATFSETAGNMLRNPIDYSQSIEDARKVARAVDLLTRWDEVDLCVGFFRPSHTPQEVWLFMLDWGKAIMKAYRASHKPVAYILENVGPPDRYQVNYQLQQMYVEEKFALYFSFPGAAGALKKVIDYNERHARWTARSSK
jgi:acyl-CoA synthetase (NDP forming)